MKMNRRSLLKGAIAGLLSKGKRKAPSAERMPVENMRWSGATDDPKAAKEFSFLLQNILPDRWRTQ